jgi:transcriptional regulator with XRE-family HTH domain
MLGFELRARRQKLGVSQISLAALAGTTNKAISIWEQGRNPIPRLAQIALDAVLSDLEAGRRTPPILAVSPRPQRGPFAAAIRSWVLAHL